MEKILLMKSKLKMEEIRMDTSNLKNIVVLKDLPSNLVEEAIVVLKENQKKLEIVDKSKNNKKPSPEKNAEKLNSKDYIVKEAQMLISDYISKIENKNKKENQSIQDLQKKYKKIRKVNHLLIASILMMAAIQFMI